MTEDRECDNCGQTDCPGCEAPDTCLGPDGHWYVVTYGRAPYQIHAEDCPTCQTEAEARMMAEARAIGHDDGKAAASWLFDGNTTRETYEAFRRGLEDGDPEILDSLPHADLSGEWADGLTPDRLGYAVGLDPDSDPDGFFLTELCDAYCEAFDAAVTSEVERVISYQLAGE